jgi:hypothetical protein
VHPLDTLIGAELPVFRSDADVRAFEQTPYAERIAAHSTYEALQPASIRTRPRFKPELRWDAARRVFAQLLAPFADGGVQIAVQVAAQRDYASRSAVGRRLASGPF